MLIGLGHVEDSKNGSNVPDSEVRPTLVSCRYMLGRYNLTMTERKVENVLIKECRAFVKIVLRVFANHSFGLNI